MYSGRSTPAEKEKMLEIGEKLAAARKAAGFTQSRAAQAAGRTQSYLSAVEHGKKAFSVGFILDLIALYGVSYEAIFGECAANGSLPPDTKVEQSKARQALSLLEELVRNSGSELLEKGVEDHVKLCIYALLRQLYQANPHNTSRVFSADAQKEFEVILKIIRQMPRHTESILRGCRIDCSRLELAQEKGHELRTFIKECEELLGCGEEDTT